MSWRSGDVNPDAGRGQPGARLLIEMSPARFWVTSMIRVFTAMTQMTCFVRDSTSRSVAEGFACDPVETPPERRRCNRVHENVSGTAPSGARSVVAQAGWGTICSRSRTRRSGKSIGRCAWRRSADIPGPGTNCVCEYPWQELMSARFSSCRLRRAAAITFIRSRSVRA